MSESHANAFARHAADSAYALAEQLDLIHSFAFDAVNADAEDPGSVLDRIKHMSYMASAFAHSLADQLGERSVQKPVSAAPDIWQLRTKDTDWVRCTREMALAVAAAVTSEDLAEAMMRLRAHLIHKAGGQTA